MVDTTHIRTGFDVEIQLGGPWFAVAIQGLIDTGVVTAPPPAPPGTPLNVTAVTVLADDPVNDLQIDLLVGIFPIVALAALTLSDDGTQLTITTDQGFSITVPFGVLAGLGGSPTLTKAPAGADTDPAVVLLANLDIRASSQEGPPLDAGEHLPRGDALLVESFLPTGRHIAFGVGKDTFPRLANDVWHTQLTVADGTQPLPDAPNKIGSWHVAEMETTTNRIRLKLAGEVPIDFWPDADVEITIDIGVRIVDGGLEFDLDVDSDVDTGVLGDLFAFLIGGLVGLIIGAIFGPALVVAGLTGAVLGVIVLEVGEAIAEGVVTRQIRARLGGEVLSVLACDNEVIASALPPANGGIGLTLLNAIPRSIPIHQDAPDPLHQRNVLVTTDYAEVTIDADGFAAAGSARIEERFQPVPVRLVGRVRTPDEEGELSDLVYDVGGTAITVPLSEALTRVGEGALLENPLRIVDLPSNATTTLLDGTLASVCLAPDAVRRGETVVTDIHFSTGLDLRVPEAIMLQESGLLILPGLQLIRPANANPYYRSPANDTTADNFESLPPF